MGGLAWLFGMALVLYGATGCGGSEFSGEKSTGGADAGLGGAGGSGGADAATGGSGGSSGSGGGVSDASSDGDAAPSACIDTLYQKSCDDPLVTTGDATCDQCGRTSCCTQTNNCLANQACAQQLNCYLENCLGKSALGCMPVLCSTCLAGTAIFIGVSSCLQTNCQSVCPMLIQ